MGENPEKKSPNKWMVLVTMPFQMGIIIYGFYYLGSWLGEKYASDLYVKIFTLLGVFIAIYNVIRQVKQLNNTNEK